MSEGSTSASRLAWGARRYAGAALLTAVLVATLVALSTARIVNAPPVYRAEALVVAAELQIKPEALPRLAEAVFNSGDVARIATSDSAVPWTATELIPDHAELVPLEANVLLKVFGIADDPQLAATTADAVADALAEELNRPGPGVGRFTLQSNAEPPAEPEPNPARLLIPVLGAFAAIALAAGVVGLLLVLRSPLIEPSDVARVVGAPVFGTPQLPLKRRGAVELTAVHGLSALLKRLFPIGDEVVALVSTRQDEAARHQLVSVVARGRARVERVEVVPSVEELPPDLTAELDGTPRVNVRIPGDVPLGVSHAVIIEGSSFGELDLPQFLPEQSRVALVVREGSSERQVERLAEQFLPGELAGVVFVRRGTTRSRGRISARPDGGHESLAAPATPAGTADSSETADTSATS